MKKENSAKQEITDKIFNYVDKELTNILKDDSINKNDKIDKADVLFNMFKVLKDYDINMKVLNDYWVAKHREEKFRICSEQDKIK